MTYCVGMMLDRGLVFMSDTRTNAGVDNVSVFAKTRVWHVPGDRTLVMMTSGNLATTQAVLGRLEERNLRPEDRNDSLTAQPSMFMTAELVGKTLREEIRRRNSTSSPDSTTRFSASIILGGQIAGSAPQLFLIYPEGNFIQATEDTPFFQIGETKYGRPIIVRAYRSDLSFMSAVKLLTVSFDSTIKANLSVGLPLDVTLVERDTLAVQSHRMTESEPYYSMISSGWGDALTAALSALPDPDFADEPDATGEARPSRGEAVALPTPAELEAAVNTVAARHVPPRPARPDPVLAAQAEAIAAMLPELRLATLREAAGEPAPDGDPRIAPQPSPQTLPEMDPESAPQAVTPDAKAPS